MVFIAEAERIMSERRGEGRIRAGETRKGCTGSEEVRSGAAACGSWAG